MGFNGDLMVITVEFHHHRQGSNDSKLAVRDEKPRLKKRQVTMFHSSLNLLEGRSRQELYVVHGHTYHLLMIHSYTLYNLYQPRYPI